MTRATRRRHRGTPGADVGTGWPSACPVPVWDVCAGRRACGSPVDVRPVPPSVATYTGAARACAACRRRAASDVGAWAADPWSATPGKGHP